MAEVTTVGIDLARNVSRVHAVDEDGAMLFPKTLSRARLLPMMAQWPACLIGLQACSGSHLWARRFQAHVHDSAYACDFGGPDHLSVPAVGLCQLHHERRCFPNTPARRITRSDHESARDIARSIGATEQYQRTRKERKKVEMLFAHLKRILRLDRLRQRGLSGAADEFTMAAAAQNLQRLAMLLPQGPPATCLCAAP